jgi:hypothetical protein
MIDLTVSVKVVMPHFKKMYYMTKHHPVEKERWTNKQKRALAAAQGEAGYYA